jgi:hypothetical protein
VTLEHAGYARSHDGLTGAVLEVEVSPGVHRNAEIWLASGGGLARQPPYKKAVGGI